MSGAEGEAGGGPAHGLAPRAMPRAEGVIAPIVWRFCGDGYILEARDAVLAGADWFYLPAGEAVDVAAFARRREELESHTGRAVHVIVGVSVEELTVRASTTARERLAELGARRVGAGRQLCDAVMLQGAVPSQLKGGRPFHRLAELRDRGLTRYLFLEAEDVASAEWLVEHTAAHAVSLPYGPGDLTAGYRVLPAAAELGTAVLARRPAQPAWQPPDKPDDASVLALTLADRRVASVILPLPPTAAQVAELTRAVTPPPSEKRLEDMWNRFREQVPEPPRPRGAHPPEYGA